MSLIDKWKKTDLLKEDDPNLANLLEYMATELNKSIEESDLLSSKVLPLTVELYKEGIKHFDFILILQCLQQGKDNAVEMYKKLIENKE
jgi:hypothetical protein